VPFAMGTDLHPGARSAMAAERCSRECVLRSARAHPSSGRTGAIALTLERSV